MGAHVDGQPSRGRSSGRRRPMPAGGSSSGSTWAGSVPSAASTSPHTTTSGSGRSTTSRAFWASIWDYFEIRAHVPYERVLGAREMPGAEWFPGARLNFAEHMLGRDEDVDRVAVVAHSQTREPIELTFGELRRQVAWARAGLQRLGVGPETGSSPTSRTSRRRSSPSSPRRAWARSGPRARRSSASAASSTGSASSSRRCCSRWPATAGARSSSTDATRSRRSASGSRASRRSIQVP